MQSSSLITLGVVGAFVLVASCKVDDGKYAVGAAGAGGLENGSGPRDPCATFPCKAGEICVSITRGFDCLPNGDGGSGTGGEGGESVVPSGGGVPNNGAAGNASTAGGSSPNGGGSAEAGGTETGGTEGSGAATGGAETGGGTTGTGGTESTAGVTSTGGTDGGEACEPACRDMSVCVQGDCICPGSLSYCDEQCVDTQTDADYCGSNCGESCGDEPCVNGKCGCPSGNDYCGSSCVDILDSTTHCGGCNQACASPRECQEGDCNCPDGLEYCAPSCVDQEADPEHCGSCDKSCTGAEECLGGACLACSTGCAVLTTTVSSNMTTTAPTYSVTLSQPVNLVGATIVVRVYVASSFKPEWVQLYFDDTATPSGSVHMSKTTGTSGWFDIVMADIAGYDDADSVNLIGINQNTFPSVGTSVVYIDSITISTGVAGPWNFAASGSPLVYNAHAGVSGTVTWRGAD